MDEKEIQADADRYYGMALWYAWGRKDSGEFDTSDVSIDAFAFAESVKKKRLAFVREQTHMFESIQGLFENFVNEQSTYSLSDCFNYETNTQGDCGGRVELVTLTISNSRGTDNIKVPMCENCRNK